MHIFTFEIIRAATASLWRDQLPVGSIFSSLGEAFGGSQCELWASNGAPLEAPSVSCGSPMGLPLNLKK